MIRINAISFFLTWCGITVIAATWHVDSMLLRWTLVISGIILLRIADKTNEVQP